MIASAALRKYVRDNFAPEAVVIMYTVSSEYNDEGHNNTVVSATVRNAQGIEVLPNGGYDAFAGARARLMDLAPTIPGMDADYAGDMAGDFCVLIGG